MINLFKVNGIEGNDYYYLEVHGNGMIDNE